MLLAGSALAKVLGIYIALLAGHFPLKVHGIDIILFLGSALVGVCLFARKLFPLRWWEERSRGVDIFWSTIFLNGYLS